LVSPEKPLLTSAMFVSILPTIRLLAFGPQTKVPPYMEPYKENGGHQKITGTFGN